MCLRECQIKAPWSEKHLLASRSRFLELRIVTVSHGFWRLQKEPMRTPNGRLCAHRTHLPVFRLPPGTCRISSEACRWGFPSYRQSGPIHHLLNRPISLWIYLWIGASYLLFDPSSYCFSLSKSKVICKSVRDSQELLLIALTFLRHWADSIFLTGFIYSLDVTI